jgi:hypothetical protein
MVAGAYDKSEMSTTLPLARAPLAPVKAAMMSTTPLTTEAKAAALARLRPRSFIATPCAHSG